MGEGRCGGDVNARVVTESMHIRRSTSGMAKSLTKQIEARPSAAGSSTCDNINTRRHWQSAQQHGER